MDVPVCDVYFCVASSQHSC